MSRKLKVFIMAILLSLGTGAAICAETNNSPVDLSADSIEYDSVQGIMNAQGSVKMIRDKAVMTGPTAVYNTKTKEGLVTGGVKVVREDTTLTAAEVRSYENNYLVATGNAVLVKGDNTLTGPKIEHWTDKQYSLVTGGARMTMPDGWMTANKVEAFHNEDRAVGTGEVHIVSDTRKLDATSDQAVYYGAKTGQQGKTVLTGNARAVQDGNVMTGNTMTIYLDDKAMDAQGRPKLVVKPQ
jgi:lipopolysaccharide export system protein LptA